MAGSRSEARAIEVQVTDISQRANRIYNDYGIDDTHRIINPRVEGFYSASGHSISSERDECADRMESRACLASEKVKQHFQTQTDRWEEETRKLRTQIRNAKLEVQAQIQLRRDKGQHDSPALLVLSLLCPDDDLKDLSLENIPPFSTGTPACPGGPLFGSTESTDYANGNLDTPTIQAQWGEFGLPEEMDSLMTESSRSSGRMMSKMTLDAPSSRITSSVRSEVENTGTQSEVHFVFLTPLETAVSRPAPVFSPWLFP